MTRQTASKMVLSEGQAVKQMGQESEADFKKLQHFLDNYFDLRDQDDLCNALKIDAPRILGQTRKTRAANIIKAVVKVDRLPDLTALIRQERPFLSNEVAQLNLPDHATVYSLDFIKENPLPFVRSIQLAEQLAGHLEVETLPDHCFDLDIVYENLGGVNHLENVQNLVSIIESRDELDVLLAYLNEKWPSIEWLDGA